MNDNEELSDSAVLSAVRDSVSGVTLPTAPRLDAITARGRTRRRRRVGGLSIAGAGACAALVVGLAGGSGAARHDAPSIQLAAFSVVAGPGDATTLTLYPGQVADPDAVRQALAEHGIPALVTAGSFCRMAGQQAPDVQFMGLPQPPPSPSRITGSVPAGYVGFGPFTIYGSAIPNGFELSMGYRQAPYHREVSFTLIQVGAPLTCTSIPG